MQIKMQIAAVACALAMAGSAASQTVSVPPNLRVPSGNTLYLKTFASGTQNYICLASSTGPAWKFLGPQATVFVTFPWFGGEGRQQVATHYLSANPDESGTQRPTWQHSVDSSTVWGRAAQTSSDPAYVAPGAIPWLLVEITGSERGPMRGSALTGTTFIQRINTSGGVAPATGCDASTYGTVAMVPYTTDYLFFKPAQQ